MLTTNDESKIISLHDSGIAVYKIAKELGVSLRTIYRTLAKHERTAPSRITLDEETKIVTLYDEGKSAPKISKILGFSCGTIYRCLSKYDRKFQSKSRKVKIDKWLAEEIIRHHKSGLGNPEISSKTGLPYYAIRSFLRKHKLKSNTWISSNPIIRASDGKMYCILCKEWLTPSEFREYKNRKGVIRWFTARKCKNCVAEYEFNRINNSNLSYFQYAIRRCRAKIKRNKIPFDLDAEYLMSVFNLQYQKCFFSDIKLSAKKVSWSIMQNAISIDRVIPALGYTKGNIVLVARRVNTIKSDMSLAEMKEWTPGWYQRLIECPWLQLPKKKLVGEGGIEPPRLSVFETEPSAIRA